MKTIAYYEVKIPDYALTYIINNDESGITEEDRAAIDKWLKEYDDIADKMGGHALISLDDNLESYFTWNPSFGSACNVFDGKISILTD